MSSKPKRNASKGPHAISAQAAETGEASVRRAAREEDIRRRAYEIYLERGEQPADELDDWLRAERELEGGERRRVRLHQSDDASYVTGAELFVDGGFAQV
jgi:NAD(P)-dependent dehydrogenase (short-subunit alcohol dehydrogenase family)